MDQAAPSSGQSTSPRTQSEGDINPPKRQSQHDPPTFVPDSLQLPARSHVVGTSSTTQPLNTPSMLMTPQSPSIVRPGVDAEPVAPVTPPAQAENESEQRVHKKLLSLLWSLIFNGVQTAFIIDLLIVSSGRRSTLDPRLSELAACSMPLGAWDAVWAVKLCFDCLLSFWNFRRAKAIHLSALSDIESPRNTTNNQPSPVPTAYPNERDSTPPTVNNLLHSNLRRRLSMSSTIFSVIWFIVTNSILFSSLSTCRLTSPHLWWLTFGLLAVIYLTILPFFLVGVIFLVIIPLFYTVLNTFLIFIGRPPLRIPYVQTGVGKLSKSVVDRIPLVIYIPPPPEDDESNNEPIAKPKPIYGYPPKLPTPTRPQRSFAFLRTKLLRKEEFQAEGGEESGEGKAAGGPKSWEDNWEHFKYPFVRLEGNRATCAICLMDFEEPKRVKQENEHSTNDTRGVRTNTPEENQIQVVSVENGLRLEDAGEGAQPLRLLACGHVFHQTCLDPWLIGVSGRCPMCQRPVELPWSKRKPKRDQNP